MPINIVQSV